VGRFRNYLLEERYSYCIWALCQIQNFSSPSQHLHTVANTATGVFSNIFPFLARYSAPTQSNKPTLYKLFIRSIITYAVTVWSSTCSSIYLRLQAIQSKCLRVIGNYPRRTPTSHLHKSLNMEPIPVLIHRLTDKFFARCPFTPQTPSPTNRGLYSSRPDWLVQKNINVDIVL